MGQKSHQQNTTHPGDPEEKVGSQFRRVYFLFIHDLILNDWFPNPDIVKVEGRYAGGR
jgi:hypothetical protein